MILKKCSKCGAMVEVMKDCHCKGCGIICCEEPMQELKANQTDGAKEKHVPDCKIEQDTVYVNIGSTTHPMEEAHYIEWIAAEYPDGTTIKYPFNPGDEPNGTFDYQKGMKIYSYCNTHGLWMKEI